MVKITNGFVVLSVTERSLDGYIKSGWKECRKFEEVSEEQKPLDEQGLAVIDNGKSEIASDIKQKQSRKTRKTDRAIRK